VRKKPTEPVKRPRDVNELAKRLVDVWTLKEIAGLLD
jgi:hypothetical protein